MFRKCDSCGEPIGVWESAVWVDGVAYKASPLARPDLAAAATECYHRTCFRNTHPESDGLIGGLSSGTVSQRR